MQRLGSSVYQRVGHTTYIRLLDQLGQPVPGCIRDAQPAPRDDRRRTRRGR